MPYSKRRANWQTVFSVDFFGACAGLQEYVGANFHVFLGQDDLFAARDSAAMQRTALFLRSTGLIWGAGKFARLVAHDFGAILPEAFATLAASC